MTSPAQRACAGAIDGVNKTFTVPSSYVPGTLIPYLNGQLSFDLLASESPPVTFVLTIAPIVNDEVAAYYREA